MLEQCKDIGCTVVSHKEYALSYSQAKKALWIADSRKHYYLHMPMKDIENDKPHIIDNEGSILMKLGLREALRI
jgi:hypothetical protein